jgi:hypothetical protein
MSFQPSACCSVLFALVFAAHADTFTLKDGSTLEGAILREENASYVLEVQVTKSIKDERVVPKDDVVKIQRSKPDLVAFESIAKLAEIPDMLTEEQYAERIRTVEKFLKDHRGSDKSKEARAIIAKHKAEANEISAGGIKLDGKIIPPGEYRANALEIDAGVAEKRIRALLAEGLYLQALRAFSSFDADFRNTRQHSELLPLMLQAMRQHITQVEQTLAGYDNRMAERQTGLDRMQMDDRRKTEAALKEENAAFEARFKSEKDAKLGWVSTDPHFKPSLDETLTFGRQEISRLTNLSSMPQTDAGKAYREALQKIQNAENAAAISAALSEARAATVPQKYLTTLEAAAASATSALAPK